MTHQRYGILFLTIAVIAAVLSIAAHYVVIRVLMIWLAVSCLWVTAAFFLHRPEMILGKKQERIFFFPFAVINFPFLAAYWSVWAFRHLILRHEPVHAIPETNISISCWPAFHLSLNDYNYIIDVTSEMPKLYRTQPQTKQTQIERTQIEQTQTENLPSKKSSLPKYLCLPNLDGVPLDRFDFPKEIHRGMKILVHCAQGRGRSAVMTCLLLVKLGYVSTGEDAFQLLKSARPNVHVSRCQMKQIQEFSNFERLQ